MKSRIKNKFTPKQIKILKKYWAVVGDIHSEYWGKIAKVERDLSGELGIKDIEIFHSDDGAAGIGNADRTIQLWQPK
jgi:hypothetical protein